MAERQPDLFEVNPEAEAFAELAKGTDLALALENRLQNAGNIFRSVKDDRDRDCERIGDLLRLVIGRLNALARSIGEGRAP